MQSAVRIILSLSFLAAVAASAYHSGAKLRRDGVLNLYPFPRVGRSGPRSWQIPMNDMYLESEPIKRQLYAFPRVGRSRLDLTPLGLEELLLRARVRPHGFVKRGSEDPDKGMWFGPRLGRGFQSEDDDSAKDSSERSDQEQVENADRQKRESENA